MPGLPYRQINRVLRLPIDKIDPNPYQPRRIFEPEALAGLAASIAENGLINPITVRSAPLGRFELIAGERRLEAVRMLGLRHINAIVEEVDTASSAVAALVENLQRQQLGLFEEAEGIAALMRYQNMTQQQVAARLGMAQSTVANKLRLLRLPHDIRARIGALGLTERHARALLPLLPDVRRIEKALDRIGRHNLNVRQTEELVAGMVGPPRQKGRRVLLLRDLRIFFNTVDKAVRTMREAGVGVDAAREEQEDCYRYVIIIPKLPAQPGKARAARNRRKSADFSALPVYTPADAKPPPPAGALGWSGSLKTL